MTDNTESVYSISTTPNPQISFVILDESDQALNYQFVKRPNGFWISLALVGFTTLLSLVSPPSFPWGSVPYTFVNLGMALFITYLIWKTPTEERMTKHPLTLGDVSKQDIIRLHQTVQRQQSPKFFQAIKNFLKIANAVVFAGVGGYTISIIPAELSGWESLVNYFPLYVAFQAVIFQAYISMLFDVVVPIYLNNQCTYLAAKVHKLFNHNLRGE